MHFFFSLSLSGLTVFCFSFYMIDNSFPRWWLVSFCFFSQQVRRELIFNWFSVDIIRLCCDGLFLCFAVCLWSPIEIGMSVRTYRLWNEACLLDWMSTLNSDVFFFFWCVFMLCSLFSSFSFICQTWFIGRYLARARRWTNEPSPNDFGGSEPFSVCQNHILMSVSATRTLQIYALLFGVVEYGCLCVDLFVLICLCWFDCVELVIFLFGSFIWLTVSSRFPHYSDQRENICEAW